MADQLAEYESQLRDVETLLQASPGDESLISLKSDLIELINITRQSASAPTPSTEEDSKPSSTNFNVFDKALQDAVGTSVGADFSETRSAPESAPAAEAEGSRNFVDTVEEAAVAAAGIPTSIDTSSAKQVPKKKSRNPKQEFEVPKHLLPLDTDTAAERNKKRRAVKALKSKWRESKKEAESEQKQKSWQSFQKKKKLKTSSMFSTTTGDAAVGVVVSAKRRQKDS